MYTHVHSVAPAKTAVTAPGPGCRVPSSPSCALTTTSICSRSAFAAYTLTSQPSEPC